MSNTQLFCFVIRKLHIRIQSVGGSMDIARGVFFILHLNYHTSHVRHQLSTINQVDNTEEKNIEQNFVFKF